MNVLEDLLKAGKFADDLVDEINPLIMTTELESYPGSLQINLFPGSTGTGVLSAAVDLRSEIAEGIMTSDMFVFAITVAEKNTLLAMC